MLKIKTDMLPWIQWFGFQSTYQCSELYSGKLSTVLIILWIIIGACCRSSSYVSGIMGFISASESQLVFGSVGLTHGTFERELDLWPHTELRLALGKARPNRSTILITISMCRNFTELQKEELNAKKSTIKHFYSDQQFTKTIRYMTNKIMRNYVKF